jgi:hypothetical protein
MFQFGGKQFATADMQAEIMEGAVTYGTGSPSKFRRRWRSLVLKVRSILGFREEVVSCCGGSDRWLVCYFLITMYFLSGVFGRVEIAINHSLF